MKLLLVAVNAKYVHTNLAFRYLLNLTENICETHLCEYSINDSIMAVERDIIIAKPDAVAFSCYIWNIQYVLNLSSDIKKALPDVKIILGGPEVSYDSDSLLSSCSYIDYIVKGEGELSFPKLAGFLAGRNEKPECGIAFRENDKIIDTGISPLPDFSQIPFPYNEKNIKESEGRIIYYETSRGCPYSCKYCLSGERGRVRFKDLETVKKELKFFSDMGVPLVKFVDRTFNADKKRAMKIWEYISSLKTQTRFHMEITGELLDEQTINLLQTVNPDNLQFEIGVQSTNSATLSAINRKCNIDMLFDNIRLILSKTKIHVHLDLIAGLPYEGFESFKKSFNDVLSLKPHVLQLGFLKLLKGSAMRGECDKYNIQYRQNAPYEIISNQFISAEELIFLKDIDYVFDRYYNSSSFVKTFEYLFEKYDDKFSIFTDMVEYFRKNNYINSSFSKQKLYDIIYDCFKDFGDEFEDALRYDLISSLHPGKLPLWCNTDNSFTSSQQVFDFLKSEDNKKKYLPHLSDRSAKSIVKHLRFEKFKDRVLVFDYNNSSVYDVSEYFMGKK
jgi:radical SAM superfamily enzyme YgiQ (UPF0313 family)